MSFPIKTNQLQYEIDYKGLDQKFDIFMVSTSDKYFKKGVDILDVPLLENNVLALKFSFGRTFWVLMKKGTNNIALLKSVLKNADGAEKVTISQQKSAEVYKDTLLQLFLNSLGTSESKYLRFNNLTGHLYCFHPKWTKYSKRGTEATVMKIPTLEISISRQCELVMSVHTFSNILLRNRMTFGSKKFEEYPQYIMTGKNILRRKLESDDVPSFIMRQTDNNRIEIPFLDIQNIEKFSESKMGILNNILNEFNKKFNGFIKIRLQEKEDYIALDYDSSIAKENIRRISKSLSKKSLKIIDCIDNEYSKVFCDEIVELIKNKYGVDVCRGRNISSKHYNIRVIHNKEYYGGENDPHDLLFTDRIVQHITLEDFYDCRESAVKTIINELLIKEDISNRKISLFDWKSLDYQSNWTFGVKVDINKISRYIFMTVHSDGTFEFSEQELNLFEMNEYSKLVEIFDTKSENNGKVFGIIKNDNEEINVIYNTDLFTIPEIDKLYNELSNGNTYLRNKGKRTQLLSACLDIKYFIQDNKYFYFVGTIGNGMKATINASCKMKKIESYGDSSIFFEKLLPLMNVTFVRNGQLTMYPFPFKYLREYIEENYRS